MRVFKGLNNTTDPMRLGLEWLVQADNVDVSDEGALSARPGYTSALSAAVTAAYTTIDFERFFYVAGGNLKTFEGATLATGLTSAPMYWAEVNQHVYYNNGVDRGVITPGNNVVEWAWTPPHTAGLNIVTGTLPAGTYQVRCTRTLSDGRETGPGETVSLDLTEGQGLQISGVSGLNVYIAPANSTVFQLARASAPAAFVWDSSPDFLGRDLLHHFLDPIPKSATIIQIWKGRAYAAMYMPATDQTVVWYSQPLGYHLFNLNSNFFIVPNKVLCMAPHEAGLIIGTDAKIYSYEGSRINELAPYGVVPGWPWALDDKNVLLWTQRGLCQALPLKNLIIDRVSVAPGTQAGAVVMSDDGQKKFVVALHQGGLAFNQR